MSFIKQKIYFFENQKKHTIISNNDKNSNNINIKKKITHWNKIRSDILNKPYKELVKIWKSKKIYRDQFDEKWLMGNNLHGGKLGSKYIKDLYIKTN